MTGVDHWNWSERMAWRWRWFAVPSRRQFFPALGASSNRSYARLFHKRRHGRRSKKTLVACYSVQIGNTSSTRLGHDIWSQSSVSISYKRHAQLPFEQAFRFDLLFFSRHIWLYFSYYKLTRIRCNTTHNICFPLYFFCSGTMPHQLKAVQRNNRSTGSKSMARRLIKTLSSA